MPKGEWSDYQGHVLNKLAGRGSRWLSSRITAYRNQYLPWNKQTAVEEADRVLNGELKYFAHKFIKIGFPPIWNKDPISDIELNSIKHWSQISDDSETDIKFIWEANRFAFVYTLVRAHAATRNEKYAEAFWALIEDWAQHNPPNAGPNWKDGQEIALRLMAWTFAFHHFSNSPSSTPQRIENFVLCVAAQAERIYKNIGYAISTRSNHTISEVFGLWMVGLLFPELKYANKYLSVGKRLLEQEAVAQIFPDGSYSMYSLNYHRFILQIYLYAISLGEINNAPFSTQLINSVAKSIEYLSHLIDPVTGQMPVYGSNDGALVLPLNNCDFTDYRPLLQLGWYITKGERLFESGEWDEDIFWLCSEFDLTPNPSPERRGGRLPSPIGRRAGDEGETSFPRGGIYLLHQPHSHAIIHCREFTSRPSHADQLHVDLWIHSQNLAIDAGTYLYSGEGIWRNGLARTAAHNTVIVDGKDQMTMLSRFTWANWSKGKVLKHDKNLWQGEHDGYKPVTHKRTVMRLDEDRWLVIDHLVANGPHRYALHWLLSDFPFEQRSNSVILSVNEMKCRVQVGMAEGDGTFSIVRADRNSTRGWRSRYYGHKEPAISLVLEADQKNATFWTFFGFEADMVELEGNRLKVNSKTYVIEGER